MIFFLNILLLLSSLAFASHDFTGHAFGLGSTARTFLFSKNTKPSPWDRFSTTGPMPELETGKAAVSVTDGGKPSIITSEFAMYYGKATWLAEVASGEAITSFKISGAYSGLGLLVSGTNTSTIICTYNGTDGPNDFIPVHMDLSKSFHTFSIEWTSTEINWEVDGVVYKSLNITSLTNPIDVENWPTTPDTINYMVESTNKHGSQKYTSYLQYITVQDYSGGVFYQYENNAIKVYQSGTTFQTTNGKTVTYPNTLLSSYVKRDDLAESISIISTLSSGISSTTTTLSGSTETSASSTETSASTSSTDCSAFSTKNNATSVSVSLENRASTTSILSSLLFVSTLVTLSLIGL